MKVGNKLFSVIQQTRMFVLLWAILLLTLRDAGASPQMERHCLEGVCVTLNVGEITSEAGLCVVLPCSLSTSHPFFRVNVDDLIWYKCEQSKQICDESDMVFRTSKHEENIQAGFKGRVSLLEPDLSRNNCSIIINDLKESDSGSYQLRLSGLWLNQFRKSTFPQKTNVSVKGLSQRPTVTVPPLLDGQQATLTCTAPGLCSRSPPNITWTWKRGVIDARIVGSSEAESVSAVTTHSSSLTFTSSAEHHGRSLTCTVTFRGGATTKETVTLNVTYVKEAKITGNADVSGGEALSLSCGVESFPQSFITWTKICLQDNLEKYTQEGSGAASLFIPQVTAEHAGQYVCTVKHLNTTLVREADVVVILNKGHAILPWSIAAASLVLNVVTVSYIIFLWNSRRKVKLVKEANTYMSLRRPELSAEYDVIASNSK